MARDKEGHFIMIEGSGGYPICLQLHTQRALRYTAKTDRTVCPTSNPGQPLIRSPSQKCCHFENAM